MANSKSRFSSLLFGLLMIGCNEITSSINPAPGGSGAGSPVGDVGTIDPNNPAGNTAVVLSANFVDPVGTLNLLGIDEPHEVAANIQTTHSDAVVTAYNNTIFVVNRLGADNIQIVDPAENFQVTRQFSVGRGTNPQQILVTGPSRAYVTLLQPEDNGSSDLVVDDLLVVNPVNGTILKIIDLTPYTTDDGERFARATAMVLVGGKLYVLIQDLPSGFVSPNQSGKIVEIDLGTDVAVRSVTLSGRNPIALKYSAETGNLYVADADYVNTGSPHGGIESVDPETLTAEGIFVDDSLLGGAPGDLEVRDGKGYVTVGFMDENFDFLTKVVSFDLESKPAPSVEEVYRSRGFIQDIVFDENGRLLVGDRDPDVNGILFMDPDTGEVAGGPVTLGASPSSITFINR